MKVKVGDVVESMYGKGPIVAITKEWIVHDCGDGREVAIPIESGEVWVPIDGVEPGTDESLAGEAVLKSEENNDQT